MIFKYVKFIQKKKRYIQYIEFGDILDQERFGSDRSR